jgi:hypothetical protein
MLSGLRALSGHDVSIKSRQPRDRMDARGDNFTIGVRPTRFSDCGIRPYAAPPNGWVSAIFAASLATPVIIGQEPVGLNARESRVPAGNASLYARDVGQGPPAIVLHGGPDFDTAYLLPGLDRLADIYRLVYYDQRGRGKSADGVQPSDVALATDLEDIERVRQHFGLEAATLLGHSWGTVLALEYALRYPTRVSRLILMNPAPASSADAALLRKAYTTQLGVQMEQQLAIVTGQPYQQGDPEAVTARYRIHFTHALAQTRAL